jgi:hypothetical protein
MSSHSSPVGSDLTRAAASGSAAQGANLQLVEQLLDELAPLARSGIAASEFYRRLFERLLPAVGARGGAIWLRRGREAARLSFQAQRGGTAQVANRDLLARRLSAVSEMLDAQQNRVIPLAAEGGAPQDKAAHAEWLVLQPFDAGADHHGAIELSEAREVTPAAARNYARVLAAVAELLEDVHRQGELSTLRTAAEHWRDYDQFAQRIHRSLDAEQTTFALANEARRVIECDRVSVLIARGKKQRVAAISGVDTVERRSKAVRALEQLAARCAACGEPVWYHDGVADLPDEILKPLDAYLEESHARAVAVVPLLAPQSESASATPHIIGVLLAEHFQALPASEMLRERMGAVSGHAAIALNNALTHSRMPLARISRGLASVRWLFESRQLPKTAIALALLTAAIAALALVPADFDVEARGELQPQVKREVFAADDGVVSDLLVAANKPVKAGEPLVVLRKAELDLESRRLLGEMQTAERKLASLRAERLQDAPVDAERPRDPHQLAADEEELKLTLASLAAQQKILDEQQAALTIRSPIDGQALTWNIDQLLAARPVERGQALLSVADLAGPWVLELHVADDRAGHLLAARETLQRELETRFVLASDPGHEYTGRVINIAPTTELDPDQQPTVRVTVAFDKNAVPALRPGATAIAKIHCGRRSLGYVWLHDLYDYVYSLWW